MNRHLAIAWDESGELEVVTFDIREETFAVEAQVVREILDILPETVVPGADPLVAHVVNFRGRIIPIADLALGFNMEVQETGKDSRIVVVEILLDDSPVLIGLRTERVHEVARLKSASSAPAPEIGMRWPREHVRGLVRHDDGLIVIPDLPAIFAPLIQSGANASFH
jgi:purine-binding chemotaxis protein CheW